MPASLPLISVKFEIDGTAVDKARMQRVRLTHGLDGHCRFTAEFLSLAASGDALGGDSPILDRLSAKIDSKARLALMSGSGQQPHLEFNGVITAVVAERNQLGEYVVKLRGSSPTIFLDGAGSYQAFLESKTSDIVQKLAGDAGVPVKADATSLQFKEAVQPGESDWQYLRRLAQREGMWLYYDGTQLRLAKDPVGGAVELTMGGGGAHTLFRFTVSSGVAPGAKVRVRGWDHLTKQEIVGEGDGGGGSGLHGEAIKASAAKFKTKVDFPGQLVLPSAAEASTLAQAVAGAWRARRLIGEGESDCPLLAPGTEVTVSKAGERMSGKYMVTAVTHRFSAKGYRNRFTCLPAEAAHAPVDYREPARPAVTTALVTNLDDPESKGRIRVKLPSAHRDASNGGYESWWARLAAPSAGPSHGFYWRPEVNDEVVVAFVDGNMNEPVILGAVYSGNSAAPREEAEGDQTKNEGRIILTPRGTKISWLDTSGEEKLEITTPDKKTRLTMTNKDKGLIELECKGPVTIKADDVITFDTKKDIVLKAMGAIELDAKQDVKVAGINVTAEAKAAMSVKGANLTAEGQATAALKGGAMAEVKGAIVKIN